MKAIHALAKFVHGHAPQIKVIPRHERTNSCVRVGGCQDSLSIADTITREAGAGQDSNHHNKGQQGKQNFFHSMFSFQIIILPLVS